MSDRAEYLIPLVVPEVEDPRKLEPPTHLSFEVYYTKGGPNYFSGGVIARGIYMSATPTRFADGMRSLIIGQGRCAIVEEVSRLNAKRLREHADRLTTDVRERRGDAWAFCERVLAEYGLRIQVPPC